MKFEFTFNKYTCSWWKDESYLKILELIRNIEVILNRDLMTRGIITMKDVADWFSSRDLGPCDISFDLGSPIDYTRYGWLYDIDRGHLITRGISFDITDLWFASKYGNYRADSITIKFNCQKIFDLSKAL